MRPVQVLFLENQDSFSWNVIDRLPVVRSKVQVIAGNDGAAFDRELPRADVLVIGPGPMDPVRAGLVRAVQLAAARKLPTLGICLGHQALGMAFGARLARTTPCHGMRESISFTPSRFFPAFEGPVEVMRYHSLALAEVPPPLSVIARTAEGLAMAIEHQTLPMAGLQFHPDSYATPRGAELFDAFFRAVG